MQNNHSYYLWSLGVCHCDFIIGYNNCICSMIIYAKYKCNIFSISTYITANNYALKAVTYSLAQDEENAQETPSRLHLPKLVFLYSPIKTTLNQSSLVILYQLPLQSSRGHLWKKRTQITAAFH